ncbi:MBL fold metallo-hydrolase [Nakamurella flava]|uniref:MBL fold metallo-hydrolase n=1 Tax=Nakamurella flava TaxID=2576308 RepID=A0A4U6QL45_9ACTN|nr:MBL fold metallo-hydrolase [Nakamurella flava]TKV61019.1 MBL fold metallo-hydrolase [Nakamurella flava]
MTFEPPSTGSLTFIGNATLLIRWGELTLLTDPNFLHRGQRAYLGYGLTSKRLTEPALSIAELPTLDGIVLSHLHGDHWDRVAHRGLDRDLPVLITPHASRRLQWRGFPRATGLRTWTSHTLTGGTSRVRITALPGQHSPGPLRRLLPPVMGSMLEFDTLAERGSPAAITAPAPVRLYVSGDTLVIDELSEIPRRFPDIDTGVLHLGGTTLPGGLMVTMDGRQGADLLELIDPHTVVPVHYDDYTVMASPLADFRAEVDRRGLGDRVRYVDRGQTVPLSATPRKGT